MKILPHIYPNPVKIWVSPPKGRRVARGIGGASLGARSAINIGVLLLTMLWCFVAEAQVGSHDDTAPTKTPPPVDKTVGKQDCNEVRKAATKLVGDQAQNLISSGGMICPCSPEPGLWLERVVYCFADVPTGLIYNVVQDLIQVVMPYYLGFYGPLILVAIAIFGWKLTTGTLRNLQQDTFIFALKLGGVLTFITFFPDFHGRILNLVQGLAQIASKPFNQFADICNMGTAVKDPTLWAQWDCIFGKIVGVSAADHNSKFTGSGMFMGILGLIIALVFTGGAGLGIFLMIMYIVMTLMFTALRAVNTYLMAMVALSFLLLISPLFVPLILFKTSYQRFYIWFQMVIGYILQPMMLIVFMGIMTVALEFTIFVGPVSLFGVITNTSPNKPDYFMNTYINGTPPGEDLTKHMGKKRKVIATYNPNPEARPSKPGLPNSVDYSDELPKSDPNYKHKDDTEIGVKMNDFDAENYVKGLNKKTNAVDKMLSVGAWLERVILQLLATKLMVYTLYTMISAVPKITHDLVARRTAGNISKANILGEAAFRKGIAAVKAYLAAKTGNKQAMMKAMKDLTDDMVSKR